MVMAIDHIEIMKQIKENHKKLDECIQHEFSIDVTPDKKYAKRYRCVNCGGDVDANEKHWYEKGLHQSEKNI